MNRDRPEYANARTILSEVVPLDTPYVLFLDPGGACNFRCSFCPCNRGDFRNQERHAVMSMELFHRILDDIEGFPSQIKVKPVWLRGAAAAQGLLPYGKGDQGQESLPGAALHHKRISAVGGGKPKFGGQRYRHGADIRGGIDREGL